MLTVHNTRLWDGRRVHTYQISAEAPITYETKLYKLDDQGTELLDQYVTVEDARLGHWNWVQDKSFGNPLPVEYPSDRRSY
jgi:hypothetical protein